MRYSVILLTYFAFLNARPPCGGLFLSLLFCFFLRFEFFGYRLFIFESKGFELRLGIVGLTVTAVPFEKGKARFAVKQIKSSEVD